MKTKCLIYCTKNGGRLVLHRLFNGGYDFTLGKQFSYNDDDCNGKVVAECEVEVEEIMCCCVPYRNTNNLGYEHFLDNGIYKVEWKENINLKSDESKYNNPEIYKDDGVVFERRDKYIDTMFKNVDLKKMCLTPQQLLDYIALGNEGYALHISNLKVFDRPLELKEVKINKNCKNCQYNFDCIYHPEVVCDDIPLTKAPQNMMWVWYKGEKYCLISIRPEWVAKILNGEKTIEVRKKVLKEMI